MAKKEKSGQGSVCPYCSSHGIVLRGKRYNMSGKKQLYKCNSCQRKFTNNDGFLRMRFKPEVIERAVELRKHGSSLSEVQARLAGMDVHVSRWTISKWEKKFG